VAALQFIPPKVTFGNPKSPKKLTALAIGTLVSAKSFDNQSDGPGPGMEFEFDVRTVDGYTFRAVDRGDLAGIGMDRDDLELLIPGTVYPVRYQPGMPSTGVVVDLMTDKTEVYALWQRINAG
jgi:hypothetical protein